MRASEILTEYVTDASDMPVEELAQFIVTKCHRFIQEYKSVGYDILKAPLYRGIKNINSDAAIFSTNMFRTPVDTDPTVHGIVDDWFDENYGVRYRSQSVMCIKSKSKARSYGPLFLLFPIGKYSYVWSNKVADLFIYMTATRVARYLHEKGQLGEKPLSPFSWTGYHGEIPPHMVNGIKGLLSDADYQYTNLLGCPEGVEIMVHCDSYLAVSGKHEWYIGALIEEIQKLA